MLYALKTNRSNKIVRLPDAPKVLGLQFFKENASVVLTRFFGMTSNSTCIGLSSLSARSLNICHTFICDDGWRLTPRPPANIHFEPAFNPRSRNRLSRHLVNDIGAKPSIISKTSRCKHGRSDHKRNFHFQSPFSVLSNSFHA